MKMNERRILLVLFAPFILNLAASFFTYTLVPRELWITSPDDAVKLFYTYIWSYQSLFMIAVQVSFGVILMRRVKLSYDLRWGDAPLIISLILLAEALFFIEYPILSYHGSRWFFGVIRMLPPWARYMNALVAPFTAGIFEEVIWRGYGIESLKKFTTEGRAVLIQAVAFALWHVSPLHVLFVFIIGLAYGLAYTRRRSLAPLILAHTATDLIGFSYFLLA